jgi:predicted DsbA family dithiol-disulfide isomerase
MGLATPPARRRQPDFGKDDGGVGVDHRVQVEIWSDVACPWCYVGTARFERAVVETGVEVDVVYRSFELDPSVPPGEGPPLTEYLARKFGDRSRVQAAHARLTDAGAELDIDFRWSQMRRANTFDAHRLLAWALHTSGPDAQRALKKALLHAYFTGGRDVADAAVLAELAEEVGLARPAAEALLASGDEADFVRAEREEAYGSGISAVPTFVVEGQWMLQGALDTDKWAKALTHMQSELADT